MPLWDDLRVATRRLRASPGFTAAAVAALALGIGASTAVFSVVDAVLLAPLPYPHPDRLVRLWEINTREGNERFEFSPGTFVAWRARASSFDTLAAFMVRKWALTGDGPAEHVQGAEVSPALLPMLGATPVIGRLFRPEVEQGEVEDEEVLISHRLWLRRFGGAPGIVGRTLRIEGADRGAAVVGVLPASFDFPPGTDVWRPMVFNRPIGTSFRAMRWFGAIGRLAPGVTVEQARADIARLSLQLAAEHPQAYAGWSAAIVPLYDDVTGAVRPALLALFGAVMCMLLVACANVANLFLARFAAGRSDLAVRAALGASRGRLLALGLTESALVALAGGVAGTVVAWWLTGVVAAAAPVDVPRIAAAGLHAPVLAFALALAGATVLLFGVGPITRATGGRLHDALKSGPRVEVGRSGRGFLLGAQVALTVVLVAGAALFGRTLAYLQRTDLGFRPAGVAVVTVDLPISKFGKWRPWFRLANFYAALLDRLHTLPGVDAAGGSTDLPLDGPPPLDVGWATTARDNDPFTRPVSPHARATMAHYVVSPEYLRVMGVPLVRGRMFTPQDAWSERALTDPTAPADPSVAIVSEALARTLWPGEDAIGKRLVTESYQKVMTVIGIVGDVRAGGPAAPPTPSVYEPVAQTPPIGLSVVLSTHGNAREVAARAAATVRAFDRDLMIDRVGTLDDLVAAAVARQRFTMALASAFALAGLALAALGIYGVVAYVTARRTREMGIRVALGASRRDLVRLVVGQGLRPVVAGLTIGAGASLGLSRLIGALLVGVSPHDPLSLAAAPLLLLAAAAFACYLPARRAAQVDPATALRVE